MSTILAFAFFLFFSSYLTYLLLRYNARSRIPLDAKVFRFLTIACGLTLITIAAYAIITEYLSRGF